VGGVFKAFDQLQHVGALATGHFLHDLELTELLAVEREGLVDHLLVDLLYGNLDA